MGLLFKEALKYELDHHILCNNKYVTLLILPQYLFIELMFDNNLQLFFHIEDEFLIQIETLVESLMIDNIHDIQMHVDTDEIITII